MNKIKNKNITKKKINRGIISANAHIYCTFNNTIVTITDSYGNTLGWCNGGKTGFKGARKSTPFAGGQAARFISLEAMQMGIKNLDVFIKGYGPGRDPAVRGLYNAGLKITSITDVTALPHNGTRPSKRRRT